MATEVATRPPAFVDGKTLSANDLRLNVLSGSGGATPLASRAGVRPSGGNPGLVAALPTPVMKVRVNAGIADVPSTSATGGFYRVSWDQTDLDIDPSSAQARTDLIIVEVVDTGTSAATGKVRVLKGTSGGGRPTNGVVNAHWFSLAATAVRVNAEGTGNIRPQDVTPELQYAVAPGADLPVFSQAERDALPSWPLRAVKRLDTGNIELRNAADTGWNTVAFASSVPALPATPIGFPMFPGTAGVHFGLIPGGTYATPKLYRSGDGWVTGSSGVQDGAGGTSRILTIFPVGYRPLNGTEPLMVAADVGGTKTNLRVDVAPTGVATVLGVIPANTYIFLSSLRFNVNN